MARKNWRTTLWGCVAAAVNAGAANYGVIAGDPAAKMNWGSIVASAALAAFAFYAKDAGIEPPQQ